MILEKAGNYCHAVSLCVCCDMLQYESAVVAGLKAKTRSTQIHIVNLLTLTQWVHEIHQ